MRRFLLSAVVLVLLGSLASNVVLYRTLLGYYSELAATRLHPLGLDFVGDRLPSHEPGRPLVALLGDSRVEDWPAPEEPQGMVYVNLGLNTQTSAQIVLRFDAHVAPLQPDVVVIQAGINDLKAVALFPTLHDEIVEGCVRNLTALVERSRATGARVVLCSVIPPGQVSLMRRLVWSPSVRRAVDEVNDRLRLLAGQDIVHLDAAALLTDASGELSEGLGRDALHLADEAYVHLNQALTAILAGWVDEAPPVALR